MKQHHNPIVPVQESQGMLTGRTCRGLGWSGNSVCPLTIMEALDLSPTQPPY